MKKIHDLSCLEWSLSGWHPNSWAWGNQDGNRPPDVGPVPARVPSSVQYTLRQAGILPDWNAGLNSRLCEWVENRHWIYEAVIPSTWMVQAGKCLLKCEGLDYQGFILVNGKQIGAFCGTFTPGAFDLTPFLEKGQNRLGIVFTEIPRYLGQIGYTSQIKEWKARFNYIWDWVPRLVQIGIWDNLRLEIWQGDVIDALTLYSEYDHFSGTGEVVLKARVNASACAQVEVFLAGDAGEICHKKFAPAPEFSAKLDALRVNPWQPNGNGGQQPLYQLRMQLTTESGVILDEEVRRIGFRQVAWKACRGAPADAEPWVCCVNGVDTFLQGANWTPIRPNYADVTVEDYRRRLKLYRELGFNLMRVWGGAVLEKEIFYTLCDEMGIMVWQEFPLSSSGPDNWPPEDPQVIAAMQPIAASYIVRRQHHPSLLLWCGGNELQGGLDGSKIGGDKPVDYTHPMIAMLRATVRQLDPTRRFLPTSSSGPRFMADQADFGKGLHHDVHGPWNVVGSLEEGFKYWDKDDALFRSETGMPGAGPAALIRKYGGNLALPADFNNPFWMHTLGWHLQWPDYLKEGGDPKHLEAYVAWSQARQTKALTYAARRCKQRFPACGGIIIWMGHDCYPCPINTSIVDFDGNPKPVALALGEIFRAKPG